MEPNDFDYSKEYNAWKNDLRKENQINILNDLKYAYMTSYHYPHDFQTCCNLGNSIHYWIVDILKSEFEIHTALTYLDELMTTEDGLNLMQLTKLFSINEFSNLYSRDESKIDFHSPVCLRNMTNDMLLQSTSKGMDAMKKPIPHVQKSPCLELKKYPECADFCDWFSRILKSFSPSEILAIVR